MDKTYSISKKKTDALYKVVSDDILDARIAITKVLDNDHWRVGKAIDNILSRLQMETSQKAIDLFKKKQP